MSEQLQADFQPLMPVYGAYPIPAVLAELKVGVPPQPERLFYQGDRVIEQMVSAAVDKPLAVSELPRMENHVLLVTPHNVLIKRSSHEYKIKRNPEVSRAIIDELEFNGLGREAGAFDRILITADSTEYRGSRDNSREILPNDSWYVRFYKSGQGRPAAEIYKADRILDSYIEVTEGEEATMYLPGFGSNKGRGRDLTRLHDDCPELMGQLEAALQEAQLAILQPIRPAVTNREAAIIRSAARASRDPHTRHIGRLARLSDQFMQRR